MESAASTARREAPGATGRHRLSVTIRGAVQGVGFRPFVYRLARERGLDGWVVNDGRGVELEVEGPRSALEGFLAALEAEAPPHAVVHETEHAWASARGMAGFRIRESRRAGAPTVSVLPDLATCPACLDEMRDPADRRHRYPFLNCTACGPRFSIVRGLPYDRPRTTMAGFPLCPECAREYGDPEDRRFHAQPTACPACGPRAAWWDAGGRATGVGNPVERAARAVLHGQVVAVQGLGGFHLVCDAADEEAVATLRRRKGRPTKPLAVMARDVEEARGLCVVSDESAALLAGRQAPIVLLPRRSDAAVAEGVAPGHAHLGVMVAYTPLHHLLLEAVGRPVVATSGNRSEEPICTDPVEAVERLGGIADGFLVHDRPIERHVDDSVAWIVDGAPRLLRRARGWAPLPVRLAREVPPILAAGAQLKSAVALARGRDAWLGQHIGDLETPEAREAYRRSVADLLRLYGVRPRILAHDLHPDSAPWLLARDVLAGPGPGDDPGIAPAAGDGELVEIPVQHHHAHLASVLAEHGWDPGDGPVLGVIWDGTGYGPDGTVWGGEFLLGTAAGYRRVAHLRPFRLAGGEAAVREPDRVALALAGAAVASGGPMAAALPPVLREMPDDRRRLLESMLARGVASPVTSSAGRLFDGVSALLGLARRNRWEGEAAVALEEAARAGGAGDVGSGTGGYLFEVEGEVEGSGAGAAALPGSAGWEETPDPPPLQLDWRPVLVELLRDASRGVEPGTVAARFHGGCVEAMVTVARRVGVETVALSGGCFQNRILVEGTARRLREEGFRVLLNRQVPPNDGGVALGQVLVAAARIDEGSVVTDPREGR